MIQSQPHQRLPNNNQINFSLHQEKMKEKEKEIQGKLDQLIMQDKDVGLIMMIVSFFFLLTFY